MRHFSYVTLLNLSEDKFTEISSAYWKSVCKKVEECENEYLKLQQLLDNISEYIIVDFRDSSDFSDAAKLKMIICMMLMTYHTMTKRKTEASGAEEL